VRHKVTTKPGRKFVFLTFCRPAAAAGQLFPPPATAQVVAWQVAFWSTCGRRKSEKNVNFFFEKHARRTDGLGKRTNWNNFFENIDLRRPQSRKITNTSEKEITRWNKEKIGTLSRFFLFSKSEISTCGRRKSKNWGKY